MDALMSHMDSLRSGLDALAGQLDMIGEWGALLAARLSQGHRLLAAGNGGSAAEAQHLTAELVGRFDGERRPYSAIALTADTASITAIGNDYGYEQVFARQVAAHARHSDVVLLLSTSGRSTNLLCAVEAARTAGATCLAMTGPGPNPLASAVDQALCLPGTTANVQEAQLVAVHLLCRAFEVELHAGRRSTVDIVTRRVS